MFVNWLKKKKKEERIKKNEREFHKKMSKDITLLYPYQWYYAIITITCPQSQLFFLTPSTSRK